MNLKLQTTSKMFYAFLMALFSVWGWGQSITIDLTSAGGSANIGNNSYASGAERTWTQNTVVFGGKAITAAQSPNIGTIQFQASNGVIYNTTAIPGRIKTIQVNQNASSSYTLSGGTSRLVNAATGNYTVGGSNAGSVTGTTWTSADLSSQNYTFFALKKGANAGYINSIVITYEPSTTPNLSVTGTFNNFSYVEGNGPSAIQSVSVSGTNLDNSAVTVSAPASYEVSLTNTNDFAGSKTIAYSNGTFTNQNVYVRLKSGLASGSYNGNNLTISGGNSSASNIALSGSVTVPPPVNDLCSAATALTSGNTVNGSMVNATATSGLTASPTKKDVWYKYTALNSGNHIITANFASGADLDIHIYTGTCPTSGSAAFVGQTVGGTSEVLNANFVSGTDYYIRVIDYDDNAIAFTITLQEPLPCAAPGVTSNLNLTPTSSSVSGTFTANTASGYMVIVSPNTTLSSLPVNGTIYSVGDSFGGGTVVKYSSGNTFTANNLSQTTNYSVFVFSYNNQCLGEPFYSSSSLNGNLTTLAGPCLSEDFSSNSQPSGWIDTTTGISYSAGYADMSGVTGSITTSALSNPSQLKFDLSRTTNTTPKVFYIEVSTTSQTTGFTVIDTYTHSNTSSGNNSITVDLSAYSSNPTVYIRFRRDQGNTSPWRIDNVQVFCATPIILTKWTSSGWSNGTPSSTIDAIIEGSYSTTSQPAFNARNITIKNAGVLEVNGTNTINAADVTVEDGGNLVIKDSGVLNQTGAFKVLKNSASPQGKYVFWSSPVANQNLFTAYSNGSSSTAPLYVMSYDPATNLYPAVSNDNANFTNNAGKGYSVKVPAANASLVFGGASQVPNNGTINTALSNAGDGYNLIGNPYPSNINLTNFYTANNSAIESTLWFWDNTTGNVTTQTGNTSVNVGFATFNAQSGTWTEAPNTQSYGSAALNALGSFAKIGQGFIVKSINAAPATFTNAMRSSATAVTMNKNVNTAEGKYWIKLTTSYGNTSTQAVTYNQGASDTYDGYDSKAMGMGSDAFYSLAGTEKLVIQGRAPFQINDVVPLGSKHFENGDFTISLAHKEGLFTNGQPIYLHDKQNGTYTNLQSGNYTFAASAGDFTNRFEIVYKLNVLSTNETEKESFEVYRDGEDFVVRNHHTIQSVEVYDAAGRKIQQISPNSKSVMVKIQTKGVYILKAVSEGKPFTQKIIK